MDVEEKLFIPGGVARMPDDAGMEYFFAKEDDDEGVHVQSCASH